MIEYKDPFTCDGRLRPGASVTKSKVSAVKNMFEAGLRGDRVAAAQFTESISTSDAVFNAAYLTSIQVLEQFDAAPRTWSQIATVRELPDFRPAVLQGIFGGFEGLQRDDASGANPEGIAPVVPEASQYPYATIGDVEAAYGRLKKRGFKVGFTWEARINDAIGFFEQLPQEILNVALDTEEYEVYSALIEGTGAAQELDGGTIFTGDIVPANSPLSRNAILRAIFELSQREVNGRKVQITGGYNLVVPVGAGAAASFVLNQQIVENTDGTFKLTVQDQASALGSVNVVESAYVSGTAWYLIPAPGAVRRPLLELGRLRGNAAPELRVHNVTGNYASGGAVAPFEGSFDQDTIDMRLRYPVTGILWDANLIVKSTGAGA